jgi:SAM-dependent methyltransferase
MADRFASTAPYYAAHRPDYDDRAVTAVRDRLALDTDAVVLDLGCGTGELALPLSTRVGRVLGVDPSRPTLRVARRRAREADRPNVDWLCASDAELPAVRQGALAAATVGRALHRTDRDRTLDRLRALVTGGVALLGDPEWLTRGTREWQRRVYEVVERYVDPPERTGPVEYDQPYHEVLRARGFSDVQRATVERTLRWDADSVVGYVLSLSYCSPAVLGEAREAFERDLRAALSGVQGPLTSDGTQTVVTGRV